MIGLIEIIITLIKAMVFLERMGIPVEDVVAYFEGLLGGATEGEGTTETTTAAPETTTVA